MPADEKQSSVIQDTEAWKEGYAAGRRDLAASENPHPRGSLRSLSWRSGWVNGQKKCLKVVR